MVNMSQFEVNTHQSKFAPRRMEPDEAFDGPESELHEHIETYCKTKGWYYVHSRCDRKTTTAIGTPDFVIALPSGRTFWCEVKRRKGKRAPAQLGVGMFLEHLGHAYACVYSFPEFLERISKI